MRRSADTAIKPYPAQRPIFGKQLSASKPVQKMQLQKKRLTNPDPINIDLASPNEVKSVPRSTAIVLEARRRTPDMLDGYSQMDDLFKQAEELRLTDSTGENLQ